MSQSGERISALGIRWRRWNWSAAVTTAPAVAIVLICSALPLAWMVAGLVANPSVRHEFSFDAFRLALLGRTVGYNAAVAICATLMGLPAGFVLGRGRGPLVKILWVVLPAALLLPSLSYAYGWSQFVRMIKPALRPVGITFAPTGPADVLRCIWSLASWLWAVPAGLIGLSLRRMDTSVQQQAVLDGALRRITFRQLLGPVIASMAIVTLLATQEFSVYEPTGISVMATEVRMVFDTGSFNSAGNPISGPVASAGGLRATDQPQRAAAAVATSIPLLAVTILLAVLAGWGASRSGASDALAVGDWPRVLDTSRWTVAATLGLVAMNIGVPIWTLIEALRIPLSPTRIWVEFAPQVEGSMIVAGAAGLVGLTAALSAGGKWTKGMLALSGASFLIGGQLLAIGLIRIYNRPHLFWVYDTCLITVIAYVGRFGWLALAAGRGTWTQPWRELRDVAGVDGAGTLRTALWVIWPLAWPVLVAGGLLVGALSLTEVPATVLLMPQHPQVLTPLLMTWVHMAQFDPMIEASLLMIAVVLVPALAAITLAGLGLRAMRRANPHTQAGGRAQRVAGFPLTSAPRHLPPPPGSPPAAPAAR